MIKKLRIFRVLFTALCVGIFCVFGAIGGAGDSGGGGTIGEGESGMCALSSLYRNWSSSDNTVLQTYYLSVIQNSAGHTTSITWHLLSCDGASIISIPSSHIPTRTGYVLRGITASRHSDVEGPAGALNGSDFVINKNGGILGGTESDPWLPDSDFNIYAAWAKATISNPNGSGTCSAVVADDGSVTYSCSGGNLQCDPQCKLVHVRRNNPNLGALSTASSVDAFRFRVKQRNSSLDSNHYDEDDCSCANTLAINVIPSMFRNVSISGYGIRGATRTRHRPAVTSDSGALSDIAYNYDGSRLNNTWWNNYCSTNGSDSSDLCVTLAWAEDCPTSTGSTCPRTISTTNGSVSYGTVITWGVSYAGNGGSGSAPTSPTSVTYGNGAVAPANTYTYSGKTFAGWRCSNPSGGVAPDCGTTNIIQPGTRIDTVYSVTGQTLLLTAVWESNSCYTITVSGNGNGRTQTFYYKPATRDGSTTWYSNSGCTTALSNPTLNSTVTTYSGYTFRGVSASNVSPVGADTGALSNAIFNTSGVLTTYGQSWVPSGNTTLYAAWAYNCSPGTGATCSLTVGTDGSVDYTTGCNTAGYSCSPNIYNPVCTQAYSAGWGQTWNWDALGGSGSVTATNPVPSGSCTPSNPTTCTIPADIEYERRLYILVGFDVTGTGDCTFNHYFAQPGDVLTGAYAATSGTSKKRVVTIKALACPACQDEHCIFETYSFDSGSVSCRYSCDEGYVSDGNGNCSPATTTITLDKNANDAIFENWSGIPQAIGTYNAILPGLEKGKLPTYKGYILTGFYDTPGDFDDYGNPAKAYYTQAQLETITSGYTAQGELWDKADSTYTLYAHWRCKGDWCDESGPHNCPDGYTFATGGTDITSCYKSVAPGYYVPSAGTEANPQPEVACSAGRYCTGGVLYYGQTMSVSGRCPAGSYSDGGAINASCTSAIDGHHAGLCADDTWSDVGAGSCTTCPDAYPNNTVHTALDYCYLTLTAGQQVLVAGAGASDCAAGKYCTSTGNIFVSDTNNIGLLTAYTGTDCPTGYPNSDAGASVVTMCYSDTKQRAWTGSAVDGTVPTNCYAVTEWNSCSLPACDYVVYSDESGTGDGDLKTGCATNNANCTKTAKTVTGLSGYYGYTDGDGAGCSSCSSFNAEYPNSDDGTATNAYCYKNGVNTGTINRTNAQCVTSSCTYNTCSCTPGTCTYKDYYDAPDTTCTPDNCNCTNNVVSWTINATMFYNGTSMESCTAGYKCPGVTLNNLPGANAGRTACQNWSFATGGASACTECPALDSGWSKIGGDTWTNYTSCIETSQAPANCASGGLRKTATSATTWGNEVVDSNLTANPGYYVNGTGCSSCSSLGTGVYNQSVAGNSGGVSACYTRCTGGTYVATAQTACGNVGAGYYAGVHDVYWNDVSPANTRKQCTGNLTTIGYGAGADEVGDCGKKLHVGDTWLYLRSGERTGKKLHVKIGNTEFYGNMSTTSKNMSAGTTKKLHIYDNGVDYWVHDDSVD